jgi:hypothetical protein
MIQRLALVLAGLCLVLVAALLLDEGDAGGQAAPGVLRGSAIELVDGGGKVRAQIDVEPGGQVVLRLRDQDGTIRVKLGADRNGSGLLLNDNRTQPGIHALATRSRTSLTLRKRDRRRVLRP